MKAFTNFSTASLCFKTGFFMLISLVTCYLPAQSQLIAHDDSITVYISTGTSTRINPLENDYSLQQDSFRILEVRKNGNYSSFFSFDDTSVTIYLNPEYELEYRICKYSDSTFVSNWANLFVNPQRSADSPIAKSDTVQYLIGDSLWFHPFANDLGLLDTLYEYRLNHVALNDKSPENVTVFDFKDSVLLYIPFDEYFDLQYDTIIYKASVHLLNAQGNTTLVSDMANLVIETPGVHFYDYLDVNNMKARFNCFGNHFWDLMSDYAFFYRADSLINLFLVQSTWIGGMDYNQHDSTLHICGDVWRNDNHHFNGGPVSDSYPVDNHRKWFKTWMLSQSEIDYHRAHWWLPGYRMPGNIKTWPTHGNPDLGQAQQLAPFEDLNRDGVYQPDDGEYPVIRGDQAIFFIMNDESAQRDSAYAPPMQVEVHGMAYAFYRPENPVLMNAVFLHYDFINRSEIDYYDCYIGHFADGGIGDWSDDLMEFNVEGNYVTFFNRTESDINFPIKLPVVGVKLLQGPLMDADGLDNEDSLCDFSVNGTFFKDDRIDNERLGVTNFITHAGHTGVNGDPATGMDFYNYMQSIWKDGTHLKYGGDGYYTEPGSEAIETNFYAPGASDSCFWGTGGIIVAPWYDDLNWDKRSILSSGPFTFLSGDTQSVELAFVAAPPTDSIAFTRDTLDHFMNLLTEMFQEEAGLFELSKPKIPDTAYAKVFPNPCQDEFYVDLSDFTMPVSFEMKDISGKSVLSGTFSRSSVNRMSVSQLKPGLYFLILKSNQHHQVLRILKV